MSIMLCVRADSLLMNNTEKNDVVEEDEVDAEGGEAAKRYRLRLQALSGENFDNSNK